MSRSIASGYFSFKCCIFFKIFLYLQKKIKINQWVGQDSHLTSLHFHKCYQMLTVKSEGHWPFDRFVFTRLTTKCKCACCKISTHWAIACRSGNSLFRLLTASGGGTFPDFKTLSEVKLYSGLHCGSEAQIQPPEQKLNPHEKSSSRGKYFSSTWGRRK